MQVQAVDIEENARLLQVQLWRDRARLWPDRLCMRPIDVLDPAVAVRLLGYTYHEFDDLGGTDRTTVAGTLNLKKRRVVVVRRHPLPTVRFTTSHEVGHIALEHAIDGVHRDRPIAGLSTSPRSPMERDADKFAAHLLMPRRLVYEEFERRFGPRPLEIDDVTAYHLASHERDAILRGEPLVAAFAAARIERWGRNRFDSLAKIFQVSPASMAIQLEEFGLIRP